MTKFEFRRLKIEDGAFSLNFALRTSNFLGVDVGGTTTRVGLVSPGGEVLWADRFPTPRAAAGLLDRITDRVSSLQPSNGLTAGLGVALPGLVDRARGVLVRSVNLPFLEEFPIVEELARRTLLRAVLLTDAEAATWGEFWACDPPTGQFIHLRFGTGIACGVVLRGELQPADEVRRTHLPALVVDDRADAPVCPCGLRGCLELYAGGSAIARHPIEESAGWIVRGIGNLVGHLPLDPPPHGRGSEGRVAPAPRSDVDAEPVVVCLGGGVLASAPDLFPRVCKRWAERTSAVRWNAELRLARLGDDAGVTGAAMLAGR